jgi:hypothetical protein
MVVSSVIIRVTEVRVDPYVRVDLDRLPVLSQICSPHVHKGQVGCCRAGRHLRRWSAVDEVALGDVARPEIRPGSLLGVAEVDSIRDGSVAPSCAQGVGPWDPHRGAPRQRVWRRQRCRSEAAMP